MSVKNGIRKCLECGEDYSTDKANQKFCSKKCRFANWNRNHPRVTLAPNDSPKSQSQQD